MRYLPVNRIINKMESSGKTLEQIFQSFTGGAKEMDNRQFAKLAKDTKILDTKLTATDIDLIFSKIKDKGGRKITFAQFKEGLKHMSAKKGLTPEELGAKICSAGGPTFSGTVAQANKFHDDKNLYTGVYKNGGPSTVDEGKGKVNDISSLCDRSGADVRGVKK